MSMKKYESLICEMPPKDILEAKEGVKYAGFKKYRYYSNTAERETPVNVLLPEGYSEEREYPVLYILHGYYDNEDWMVRDIVHINTMLGNLIASQQAEEMIVVLPYIFCSKELPRCTGMDLQNNLAYDNFINDMVTDLKPFIEENFSVAKGRNNTAITGFSMGGREAFFIALSHPELFGYVGGVCPAPGLTRGTDYQWMLEESDIVFKGEKPLLLLLSWADNDGVVNPSPQTYDRIMTENGVEHLLHTMSTTGHDHLSVTPHLYNFMRMLFKD